MCLAPSELSMSVSNNQEHFSSSPSSRPLWCLQFPQISLLWALLPSSPNQDLWFIPSISLLPILSPSMAPWPFVNLVVTFCNIQHNYSRLTTTKDYKILLSGATTKGHYQPQYWPPSSKELLLLVPSKTSANFPGLFKSPLLLPPSSLAVDNPASQKKNYRSYLEAIVTSAGPIT